MHHICYPYFQVIFDDNGIIQSWNGNPIFLNGSVTKGNIFRGDFGANQAWLTIISLFAMIYHARRMTVRLFG